MARSWMEERLKRRPERPKPWMMTMPRLFVLGWMFMAVMGVYGIRLWQLQILEGGSYVSQAEAQQYSIIPLTPQRGVIFDRNGVQLVRNVPAYDIVVTPGELPEDREQERAVLLRLSTMIDMPYETLLAKIAPGRGRPYTPLTVARNVPREKALLVAQESGVTLPGVTVKTVARRSYPSGPLTAQILGYMGPISEQEAEAYKALGYDPNTDLVGKVGIEAVAESSLRGVPGRKVVEADVLGRELRVLDVVEPVTGDNVYLTLDLALQQKAQEALQQTLDALGGNRRGAVVVLDPRTGEVLALVSLPTYDNNLFARGITAKEYQELLDNVHNPLLNHAIFDAVPPGSTFKIVTASAALQEGVIAAWQELYCPGTIKLPNKFAPNDPGLAQTFYCWNRAGHGWVNVYQALAQSCDIYFYKVGGGFEEAKLKGLGVQRLTAYARQFGLGEVTGIDLYGESAGLVPDDRWKRLVYQETWSTGDTYNLSIGQGFLTTTPIQMANVVSVIANGGTLYRPQLIHHVVDAEGNLIRSFQPEVIRKVELSPEVIATVRTGLELAVSEGTAWRTRFPDIRVAGKTGSAEYCDDLAIKAKLCPVGPGQTLPTHAWFVGYAPAEAPELAIAVWVYNGGEGSSVAVPIAKQVFEFYFQRKAGTLPTPEAGAPSPTP